MMSPKIELLAPGGGVDAIKAAIIAGADAVYCGLATFNARNRAANLSFTELLGIIRLAHQYQCKIFLTLNIIILEHEFKSLMHLLNQLVNTDIDGVIVQDLGLLYLLKKYFPTLDVHASTQLTTHNIGQIPFLKKLGVSRVNLSRELNIIEIKTIAQTALTHNVLTEVFVHGSLCIAFSGLCYSTSVTDGNSGNRGRCSQACRDEYQATELGNRFPLNLKDNSAFFDLPALIDAGVYSFKVEGRIKGASYVHTVIDSFRKQIDGYLTTGELHENNDQLYKVFNRDFSNAFIRGDLNQSMFIENPRDHSKQHALMQSKAISVRQIKQVEQKLSEEKNQLDTKVRATIEYLSIDKPQLTLLFSGVIGEPLTITVKINTLLPNKLATKDQQPHETRLTFSSTSRLKASDKCFDTKAIEKRFKSFNNNQFTLLNLDFTALSTKVSIAFRELSALKNNIARALNNNKPIQPAVSLPKLTQHVKKTAKAKLSILISNENDLDLLSNIVADIYFKLPDAYKRGCRKYIDFFNNHPHLIPWFPAVLIAKDFDVAVTILAQVKPKLIITNNTGIAHKANELGIKWIAGPFLNTSNSYALLAMQEAFNCSGAFISNEINYQQIKNIVRPDNFSLFYSVYHPIVLMTSRQCFFQQSVGCDKPRIDNGCMLSCEKSTSITNLNGVSFAVDKQKAGYPSIYNKAYFLNTEAIAQLGHLIDNFMIDLSQISVSDTSSLDKQQFIAQFQQLLNTDGDDLSRQLILKNTLNKLVANSTSTQYTKGL